MVQGKFNGVRDRNYWKRKNIEDFIEFVQNSLPEEIELKSFLGHQVDHYMDTFAKQDDTTNQGDLFSEEQDNIPVSANEIVGGLFR